MVTCTVLNSPSISCNNGCCGTPENRTCCVPKISETVVIAVCVVGALVMIVVVVALIICLKNKQKNRVTRIRPQRQRIRHGNEPRARRFVFPKPPPYSEAPPQYDAVEHAVEARQSPRSTDPIIPCTRTSRHGRFSSNQPYRERHVITRPGEISDAPPPYTSIFQVESNVSIPNRIESPQPGPSRMLEDRRTIADNRYESQASSLLERTRHGSPHPSLASGRISAALIHRTTSERSRAETSLEGSNSRRQLLDRGNNSVTPVTIREITVHSQTVHMANDSNDNADSKRNSKKKISKLPKPVNKNTRKSEPSADNSEKLRSFKSVVNSKTDDEILTISESPPPANPSAAARSAQRRAILNRLKIRRQTEMDD